MRVYNKDLVCWYLFDLDQAWTDLEMFISL